MLVCGQGRRDFLRAPCAAFLLLLPISQPLAAQRAGTVAGIVVASGESTPVRARLRVPGTVLDVVAAKDGGFRMVDVPSGAQTLDVHMLGYNPVVLPIDVRAGESLFVKVTLTPVALELAAVEVSDLTALTPQLREFEDRRARGMGTFFTREDILRMQPRLFTDILRRVPGMNIRALQGGHGDNVSVQTDRGKPCAMQFYVNGTPLAMMGDSPVNYYIAPEDVVGVEVYRGSSEIPIQFNNSMNNSRCGVVVVWTRVGKNPERRR
jgi:hypothetical protein